MSKKSCQKCLYVETCPSDYPCRYYASVDDDDDTDLEIIELGREQFRAEWERYLNDAEASYF